MSIGIFPELENSGTLLERQGEALLSASKISTVALDVFQSLSNISAQNSLSTRKIYPITKTGFPNLFPPMSA